MTKNNKVRDRWRGATPRTSHTRDYRGFVTIKTSYTGRKLKGCGHRGRR